MAKTRNPLIQRLGAPQIDPPWTLAEMGLALVVLALGMLLIAPASALAFVGDTLNPDSASLLLAWIIGLMIVGGFIIIRWRRTREKFDALKFDAGRLPLPVMFVLGVGTALTASVIALFGTGVLDTSAQLHSLSINAGEIFLAVVLIVLIQPVVDSLLFAGIVLPRLRHTLGAYPGLLTMAIAFAGYNMLVYGERLAGNLTLWHGFVMPLILGIMLGVARVWGGSTRSAIVLYIGYGITSIVMMILV